MLVVVQVQTKLHLCVMVVQVQHFENLARSTLISIPGSANEPS
jgi:hypothetical protein